jgi:hypothetical protein
MQPIFAAGNSRTLRRLKTLRQEAETAIVKRPPVPVPLKTGAGDLQFIEVLSGISENDLLVKQ